MEFKSMNTVSDRYYIYIDDEVVGIIEYKEYDDEIEIKYIKIYKEFRRMGIATKVVNKLKEKCKNITGDSLPEAIEFWKSLNVYFYEPFDNDEVIITPFILKY